MTCHICNRPVSGQGVLAVPIPVSRRKTETLSALAFRPHDEALAGRDGVARLCGIQCAASALERYLQNGNLDKNDHRKWWQK